MAAKRAEAFLLLVVQAVPSAVMMVLTKEDGFLPDAARLAWKSVWWSSPERYALHELSFAWSMARVKDLCASL